MSEHYSQVFLHLGRSLAELMTGLLWLQKDLMYMILEMAAALAVVLSGLPVARVSAVSICIP